MNKLLGDSPRTTLVGAAAGAGFYGSQVGFDVPHNQGEWISFVVSILLFALGRFAGDSK